MSGKHSPCFNSGGGSWAFFCGWNPFLFLAACCAGEFLLPPFRPADTGSAGIPLPLCAECLMLIAARYMLSATCYGYIRHNSRLLLRSTLKIGDTVCRVASNQK